MLLSDTQAVLLVAAANRDDRLIPLCDRLKGGAAENVARQLLKQGLAKEIEVAANAPFWRRRDDGVPLALRITPAGLAAIGMDVEDEAQQVHAEAKDGKLDDADSGDMAPTPSAKPLSAPLRGGKKALVMELLSRANGASIDELRAATGWLPHTVRAALTRLRQSGRALERRPEAGGSRYAIVTEAGCAVHCSDDDANGEPTETDIAPEDRADGPDSNHGGE